MHAIAVMSVIYTACGTYVQYAAIYMYSLLIIQPRLCRYSYIVHACMHAVLHEKMAIILGQVILHITFLYYMWQWRLI